MEGLVLGLSEIYTPILGKGDWSGWGQCRQDDATEMRSALEALIVKFSKVCAETFPPSWLMHLDIICLHLNDSLRQAGVVFRGRRGSR